MRSEVRGQRSCRGNQRDEHTWKWRQRTQRGTLGSPSSASPSRVLPSRLINYWESQPESSVCVFASRLLPLHTCVVATTTPSIELERGVFDQEDRSTQALLFRLYSNRRLLVCLCWCFTSLIHTLILNLTELIYFVSSDVVLCLRLLLSLTPAFLNMNLEASRAAAIVNKLVDQDEKNRKLIIFSHFRYSDEHFFCHVLD